MAFRNIQVILSGNAGNLRSTLLGATRDIDRFNDRVNKGNTRGSTTANALGLAFLAAGTLIVAGLGYGIKKAVEFEASMRNVNSLTRLNEQAFKAQEKAVLSMSTRLPQSAKVLADGLYDIASSGFQGADGLTILNAAATAASAGLTTTATSAAAITAVLNAYGLQASDATDVSDVLFQTVNRGVITFEELAGVIGNVVGTAAAAKVGIDQVGAAIATMTLTGINGAEAGTSLNRVLQSIIQPSDALQATFKKLGYESGAAALQQKGLRGVMEDIRKSTGGNITQLLALFPEIRAARGALALMANEGKNYASVSKDLEDKNRRQGASLRVLKEQMKGAGLQWQVIRNQMDAAAITAGLKVLPALIALMHGAQQLAGIVGDVLSAAAKRLQPTLSAIIPIGRNLWELFNSLVDAIGPLVVVIGGGAFAVFAAVLNTLARALVAVTGFAADNHAMVMILAIAYGIHLAGGVSRLANLIFSQLIVALANSIGMMGSAAAATRGFTAALTSAAVAEAAATLGLSVIITAGVLAFQKYSNAGKDTAAALEQIIKPTKNSSQALQQQQRELNKLRGTVDAAKNSYKIYEESILGTILHEKEHAESSKRLDAAQAKLTTSQNNLNTNTSKLGQAFNLSSDQVLRMANAAGIDLTGSLDKVVPKFNEFYQAATGGSASTQAIVKAMGELANSAGDAGKKVEDLKAALDALMGATLGVNAATRNYEASIDDLTASVAANGKTLDVHTAAGRANGEALDKIATSMKDVITAQINAGTSTAIVSKNFGIMRGQLINAAIATGMSRVNAEKYATSLGLIPSTVETLIKAAGAKTSEKEVRDLIAARDALQGKTVNIETIGDLESRLRVMKLDKQIKDLKAKRVEVAENGSLGSKARVRALDDEIRRLTARKTSIITADTWQAMSATQAVLRMYGNIPRKITTVLSTVSYGAGGVPKASGGKIQGPGTGTSDDVPLWGSHGEWVINAASSAKYGDQMMAAINAGTFAGGGMVGGRASEVRNYSAVAGGNSGIFIAPGAVSVTLSVAGDVDRAKFERVAQKVVDEAFARLQRQLVRGSR